MEEKYKEMIKVMILYCLAFLTGAFLYGILSLNSFFHYPILILSVILFVIIFKFKQNKSGGKSHSKR